MKGDKIVELVKNVSDFPLLINRWHHDRDSSKGFPIQSFSEVSYTIRKIIDLINYAFSTQTIIHKLWENAVIRNCGNIRGAYHSFIFYNSNCALPSTHHIKN